MIKNKWTKKCSFELKIKIFIILTQFPNSNEYILEHMNKKCSFVLIMLKFSYIFATISKLV